MQASAALSSSSVDGDVGDCCIVGADPAPPGGGGALDDEAKTLESIRVLSQRTALAEAQARHRQLARMPVGGSGPPGLDLRTATGALTSRAGFRGPVYGFPAPGSSGFGSLSKVEAQTIATSRLYNDLADLGHPEVVREERLAGPKTAVFVHLREIMSMGGEQMTGAIRRYTIC